MATDALSHEPLLAIPEELLPNVDHLVTEDDTPVDNLISEMQQRLLVEPLKTSWQGPGDGQSFVAMANVGLFYATKKPPLVPDALLSINVQLPADLWAKSGRSYFVWEYGKAPDVVIEIVSNREGGEDSDKLVKYAEIGIRYYAIFDPEQILSKEVLRVYRLSVHAFERMIEPIFFPVVNLGLLLWNGRYEDHDATWLRWLGPDGVLIPVAKDQRLRADHEQQRADHEKQRADAAEQHAAQLAEQLRRLGIESNGK